MALGALSPGFWSFIHGPSWLYRNMHTNTTKGAEKTLRDQALILDLAKDSIFIRDTEDRITYWNQGAPRLYGWSKEEAMGHVTHSLFRTQYPQSLDDINAQ